MQAVMRSPVASTSRLVARTGPSRRQQQLRSFGDDFKPFGQAPRPASDAPRSPREAAQQRFNRRGPSDRDRPSGADSAITRALAISHATGAARRGGGAARRPARANPRAVNEARRFVLGAVVSSRKPRAMDTHSWVSQCPPAPPTSVLTGRDAAYLPDLDLARPPSDLAVVPTETRDGVVSRSWWRIATPREPLTATEHAGEYARWTTSYFATPAPRTDPAIPSWTEVLDRTLPRNRSMTLAQKRLFARTVEQLVAGNGVIKSMVGKSYVAPTRWPRNKEAQRKQVGQERLPWHPQHKPLVAKRVPAV